MHVLTTVDEAEIASLREQRRLLLDRPRAALTGDEVETASARRSTCTRVALEDTLEFGQRPKVDPYDDHLLLVFFTASRAPSRWRCTSTSRVASSPPSATTTARARRSARELADQPPHDEELLVYRILDGLTDAYYPVIDDARDQIDALEGDVLARPRREQLSRGYRLKQTVRELHRLADAQHDQFHAAHEHPRAPGLRKARKPYLRDVIDHLQQIAGEFQRQTDDLISLTQTYFNANSDRLNAVATRLTIGGTLFLAWTFVTGFFGQNFGWLVDNIDSKHDFLLFGVGGLTIPTVILLTLFWVKRRDWF